MYTGWPKKRLYWSSGKVFEKFKKNCDGVFLYIHIFTSSQIITANIVCFLMGLKVYVHLTNLKSFYRDLKYLKFFVGVFHLIKKC